MGLINEFQYPDGWYMRVGQIYSSPYEPYHVRITSIRTAENEWVIGFVKLNPKNHSESYYKGELDEWAEDYGYAWWFNEGTWDLEMEPDDLWSRLKNDSSHKEPLLSHSKGSEQHYLQPVTNDMISLKENSLNLHNEILALKVKKTEFDKRIKEMKQYCTHRNPDGTSAFREAWDWDICNICDLMA